MSGLQYRLRVNGVDRDVLDRACTAQEKCAAIPVG